MHAPRRRNDTTAFSKNECVATPCACTPLTRIVPQELERLQAEAKVSHRQKVEVSARCLGAAASRTPHAARRS